MGSKKVHPKSKYLDGGFQQDQETPGQCQPNFERHNHYPCAPFLQLSHKGHQIKGKGTGSQFLTKEWSVPLTKQYVGEREGSVFFGKILLAVLWERTRVSSKIQGPNLSTFITVFLVPRLSGPLREQCHHSAWPGKGTAAQLAQGPVDLLCIITPEKCILGGQRFILNE